MVDVLLPVPIDELAASDRGLHWRFSQAITGLQTSEPVQGHLHVWIEGPLLVVEGEARATVSLCCDRCLQIYDQPLQVASQERIGLGGTPEDLEAALDFDAGGVVEQLDPQGSFDPERWIFEQLSLQLPLVNRCGPGCPGPASWGGGEAPGDPRWAALKQLRP
jgi:uncharacterized protein